MPAVDAYRVPRVHFLVEVANRASAVKLATKLRAEFDHFPRHRVMKPRIVIVDDSASAILAAERLTLVSPAGTAHSVTSGQKGAAAVMAGLHSRTARFRGARNRVTERNLSDYARLADDHCIGDGGGLFGTYYVPEGNGKKETAGIVWILPQSQAANCLLNGTGGGSPGYGFLAAIAVDADDDVDWALSQWLRVFVPALNKAQA